MDDVTKPAKPKKTTQDKIRELEEAKRAKELQLRKLIQEQKNEEKRADTKRKVILGGWLVANRPDLVSEIVAKFARDQDRTAFEGWTPPSATSQAKQQSQAPGKAAES